jgi:hypothetical protein
MGDLTPALMTPALTGRWGDGAWRDASRGLGIQYSAAGQRKADLESKLHPLTESSVSGRGGACQRVKGRSDPGTGPGRWESS